MNPFDFDMEEYKIKPHKEELLTLDVAICTYGKDGLFRVAAMILPFQERVKYVVSWQEHRNAPIPESISDRPDVVVSRLDRSGLSNNRNNALRHCDSEIVLIADDDLEYSKHSFIGVIKAFEDNPKMDLATFRVKFPKPKNYPSDGCRLGDPMPKGYFVTSMEIAFRRTSIGNLEFNPNLGIGAPELLCGEEEIFVYEAIKRGLKCFHVGKEICCHPGVTSGNKVAGGVLMGQGYVIRRLYPVTGLPRLILKAWRIRKKEAIGFPMALYHLLKGALKKV